jgi:hypothetical protein
MLNENTNTKVVVYKNKNIFQRKTGLCTVYLPSGYGTALCTHYYKSLQGAKIAITSAIKKHGKNWK